MLKDRKQNDHNLQLLITFHGFFFFLLFDNMAESNWSNLVSFHTFSTC